MVGRADPVRRRKAKESRQTGKDAQGRRTGMQRLRRAPSNHPVNAARTALVDERDRLQRELDTQGSFIQDRPTTGNHIADDASEVLEQTNSLALREQLERMLTQVNEALARIDRGTFGICDSCHIPIEPARLQALPSATLCIRCACKKAVRAAA